jgi:hypothetical protein
VWTEFKQHAQSCGSAVVSDACGKGGGSGVSTAERPPLAAGILEHEIELDLRDARSSGAPLWDGKSKLTVRLANADEEAMYFETVKSATNGDDGLTLVYLIELDG